MKHIRPRSIAVCGGAFGDEGKGRIIDEWVNQFAAKGPVIVYRDNGGANAGHTVEFANGERLALHQLPSGIFSAKAIVVLGKGMVIHPIDLVTEIQGVEHAVGDHHHGTIKIDEMATLSLDTHRAFEAVLKGWLDGYKAGTGRGISPAYADVLLRQPMKIKDLKPFNREKFAKHYQLYAAWVKGLGMDLAQVEVPKLDADGLVRVGSEAEFIARLEQAAKELALYIEDVSEFIRTSWADTRYAFVFEKAQGLGLDVRWGAYPDVTASDITFEGITASTEGTVLVSAIKTKTAVIKGTYMSSVGSRKLPTMMTGSLAEQIRADAHEYGATTKRPRDVAYLDLVLLKYLADVGKVDSYVLTHMDIVYPKTPIKVCVGYQIQGKPAAYRPDQEYLNQVKPVYKELEPWDAEKIHAAKNFRDLPKEAKTFLQFVAKQLSRPIIMITTGPKRHQGIRLRVRP